jgi:hypothetical protein
MWSASAHLVCSVMGAVPFIQDLIYPAVVARLHRQKPETALRGYYTWEWVWGTIVPKYIFFWVLPLLWPFYAYHALMVAKVSETLYREDRVRPILKALRTRVNRRLANAHGDPRTELETQTLRWLLNTINHDLYPNRYAQPSGIPPASRRKPNEGQRPNVPDTPMIIRLRDALDSATVYDPTAGSNICLQFSAVFLAVLPLVGLPLATVFLCLSARTGRARVLVLGFFFSMLQFWSWLAILPGIVLWLGSFAFVWKKAARMRSMDEVGRARSMYAGTPAPKSTLTRIDIETGEEVPVEAPTNAHTRLAGYNSTATWHLPQTPVFHEPAQPGAAIRVVRSASITK